MRRDSERKGKPENDQTRVRCDIAGGEDTNNQSPYCFAHIGLPSSIRRVPLAPLPF